MGQLIKAFTLGRNFLKKTTAESARSAKQVIDEATQGSVNLQELKSSNNGSYNVVRDLISFTGVVKREGNLAVVTEVGRRYVDLYSQCPEDAWQWLVTRALWLFSVPNGTESSANRFAKQNDIAFAFFNLIIGLLKLLSALPGKGRFLSYQEFCELFNADENWVKSAPELFGLLLLSRENSPSAHESSRAFLGDLEDEFNVGRDNLNTVFNKAFMQTGLFEYRPSGASSRGANAIALSPCLDDVHQRRCRFVIDNPQMFEVSGEWSDFLQPKEKDLPLEVSTQSTTQSIDGGGDVEALSSSESDIHRILLARQNIILYGPPGTGKSHAAFSIADSWKSKNGVDSVVAVTFHPAFGYEDFVQGFRPLRDVPGVFDLQDGPLLLAVKEAQRIKVQGRSVLMVIDEINRGDVARIFGELITYIEPDKRERSCRLSQSPSKEFCIPDNLYFLGTMNSADKSVSLLDVALRRRFAFIEYPADPTIFSKVNAWVDEIAGVPLAILLEELNLRLLSIGVEPDRAIGHALLSVSRESTDPVSSLENRFKFDIMPLIQEYCYLDRARMQKVLGGLVDSKGRSAWDSTEDFLARLRQYLNIEAREQMVSQE